MQALQEIHTPPVWLLSELCVTWQKKLTQWAVDARVKMGTNRFSNVLFAAWLLWN